MGLEGFGAAFGMLGDNVEGCVAIAVAGAEKRGEFLRRGDLLEFIQEDIEVVAGALGFGDAIYGGHGDVVEDRTTVAVFGCYGILEEVGHPWKFTLIKAVGKDCGSDEGSFSTNVSRVDARSTSYEIFDNIYFTHCSSPVKCRVVLIINVSVDLKVFRWHRWIEP